MRIIDPLRRVRAFNIASQVSLKRAGLILTHLACLLHLPQIIPMMVLGLGSEAAWPPAG